MLNSPGLNLHFVPKNVYSEEETLRTDLHRCFEKTSAVEHCDRIPCFRVFYEQTNFIYLTKALHMTQVHGISARPRRNDRQVT